ncbi:MAG: 3-hydroxyacyl-CoA dehydrogenase family protein [Candidatus Kariarchaeaceae archaeon]|jgi:3-hydroxybutyryl-CoA dehydrogenase
MEIKKVVVIGSGFMGSGIAYVLGQANIDVVLVDQEQKFIDSGMSKIKDMIKDGISRNKMTPHEGMQLSQKFKSSLNLAEVVKDTDLVIEAVFESMDLKKEIFKTLSENAPPDSILASNTSTLSITEMATVVDNPERVIGLHFFSPVAAMKLVEVVLGEKTSETTIGIATSFVERIGKTPVTAKDSPGFIVNRVLAGMIGEAMKLYNDGIATPENIDKAMVLGANLPIGPLALADFVGLDVVHASSKTLEKELGEAYKAPPILSKLVEEGKLGMKTQEGFYKY